MNSGTGMNFFESLWAWVVTNWIWVTVGAVVVIALIVLIIVLAVHASKKKKREKAAQAQAAESVPPVQSAPAQPAAHEVAATAGIVALAEHEESARTPSPAEEDAVAEETEEEIMESVVVEEPESAAPAAEEAEPAAEEEPTPVAAEEPQPEPAAEPETKSEEPATMPIRITEEKADAPKKESPAAKKTAVKKPAPKASAPAKKDDEKKRFVGKWTIECKAVGEYVAKLSASNGEVMLTSEVYSTVEGARGGIATIIRSIESGKFIVYQDKNNNYYYKLKSAGNRLLCVGEIYQAKDQCDRAVQTVKRIAAVAPVSGEVAEGSKYIDYTPVPMETYDAKKGAKGKWKIEKTESGMFSAKLYASNGQLMLATEEVASKKSATDAIENVKRYSAQGNFKIDRDKSGRYYYKLRNGQKSVICIGEAYESLDSCIKALESVRRFASNATTEA